MKRFQIAYMGSFVPSPVSYWVHRNIDAEIWVEAKVFDPPLPKPVPAKGWARLEVEFNGIRLVFASIEEVKHVIEVLSKNPLPTTRRLSEDRSSVHGPNSHWLNRLPKKSRPLRFRSRLVKYLKEALQAYNEVVSEVA